MSQDYSLPLRYLTGCPVLFVCVCLFPKSDNSGCRVFPEDKREISGGWSDNNLTLMEKSLRPRMSVHTSSFISCQSQSQIVYPSNCCLCLIENAWQSTKKNKGSYLAFLNWSVIGIFHSFHRCKITAPTRKPFGRDVSQTVGGGLRRGAEIRACPRRALQWNKSLQRSRANMWHCTSHCA